MAIRIAPNVEDKAPPKEKGASAAAGSTAAGSASTTAAAKDLFGAHNHERLFGILGVLFNDARTQLVHPSELATVTDSNFLRFVTLNCLHFFPFTYMFTYIR